MYTKGMVWMKGKKIALLLAGLALVSSTALAANTPYGLLDSSDKDGYAKIMVYQANDMNYYRYINSTYHYALDIPTEVNKADENEGGDGCYFQDLKNKVVVTTYAVKNQMNFSLDELYNMDIGMNGSPKLTTNNKTINHYTIAWTKDGKNFYKELYLLNDTNTYVCFSVVYPTKMEKKYQKYIFHMSQSFMPSGAVI